MFKRCHHNTFKVLILIVFGGVSDIRVRARKVLLCICIPEYNTFLFRSRVFSLGCGARRGGACTRRCKCASRPAPVARALGMQSRESWQVTTGSFSAELDPSKTIRNSHTYQNVNFCVFHSAAVSVASTTPALKMSIL